MEIQRKHKYNRNRIVWFTLWPIVSVFAILFWNLGSVSFQAEANDGPLAEKAKSVVSEAKGIPVTKLNVAKVAPLADTGIRQYKLMDTEGNIHGVDLDAFGNPVSREVVDQALQEINNRGFVGKLEGELADLFKQRDDSQTINVIFWMKGTTSPPRRGDRVTPEEYEANLRTIKNQVAAIEKPLVDMLKANGQRILYQAQYAPAVAAAVKPSRIKALEARSDVERIYLERVSKPRLNISRQVVQANIVNGRGITGSGRRVGIVELGRIGSHTNLPGAQRILCRPGASTTISGHKTNVAGVVQSTNATYRGMAPSITIIDGIGASFADSEMMAATDCVIANGAVAVNMSFGSETNGYFNAFARYVDRVVYNTGRTISVAVSNICANRMGSPEIAFNCLAVGAFGDNNTTSFAGDIPPCTGAVDFSAYLDPISPSNDREEPDIVAPGHNIMTTNTGGTFSNASGTSFAAPHVTGGGGLLNHRRPTLSNKAEEVRAIMMASARHNIEGASRLSERDGAGAIMLAAADTVELNGQSMFLVTPGGSQGFPITISFSASAGQRVRVVIAWAHKSPGGDTLTRPTTDLDLRVYSPTNVPVGGSMSFDNSYEIVEFTAPATGNYTGRIINSRSSTGNEFIGWAVSRTDL